MDFLVVLEQDEGGEIVADVPELPGCHTSGRNRQEALANIREAIELYLEVEGIPKRRAVTIEHVSVEG
ncbi:MAG: type II toxin-antitoxin system HicB family antitoxin [Thermoplasmatota archaeon]